MVAKGDVVMRFSITIEKVVALAIVALLVRLLLR
jgi:hypothetical protein